MLLACGVRLRRRSPRRGPRRPSTGEPSTARQPMTLLKHTAKLALVLVALLAMAAPAGAASYHDAIRDCFDDGQLEGHYSRHQLQQALQHLPATDAEYSDCADVLRRAMTASGGRHGGGGGASASPAIPASPTLATPSGAQAASPQDLKSLNAQTAHPGSGAPPKIDLAGSPITPAAARFDSNKLPATLLASLIGLGLLSVIAGLLVLRRRWPETRRVALRLLRR